MESKISIITPSYNSSSFIEDCIQSVLNQNYSNFEHIIIDGGSTDGTIDILKKYSHLIWISEPDNGISAAFNKGIKKSNGDIIAILNSDDVYASELVFAQVNNILSKDSIVDVIYGDIAIIDSHGDTLFTKKEIGFSFYEGIFLGFGHLINHPATFCKRQVYMDVGDFDEKLKYSMDEEYWFRVIQKGYFIKHIPVILAKFSWHMNSTTYCAKLGNNFEHEKNLIIFYKSLSISKYLPYRFSFIIKNIILLFRITKKLIGGCYSFQYLRKVI